MAQHIRLASLPTQTSVAGKAYEIGIAPLPAGNAPMYCIAALHGHEPAVCLSQPYSDRAALAAAATSRFEQSISGAAALIVSALMAENKAFNV